MYFNSRPSARGDARCSQLYCEMFISIHAPPRGATSVKNTLLRSNVFQFTPLREGRHTNSRIKFRLNLFQFTPLREGRPASTLPSSVASYFNSRPSARGDYCSRLVKYIVSNFNSRPSARGDDARCSQLYCDVFISIHAPPRGATNIA